MLAVPAVRTVLTVPAVLTTLATRAALATRATRALLTRADGRAGSLVYLHDPCSTFIHTMITLTTPSMGGQEVRSLVQQLMYAYGANKRASRPRPRMVAHAPPRSARARPLRLLTAPHDGSGRRGTPTEETGPLARPAIASGA